ELGDDGSREPRDGVREEHGLGADADELATLRERRDDLAVQPVRVLELRRGGRMRRIARERLARAGPRRLLGRVQAWHVPGDGERRATVDDAAVRGETRDERGEALRR